MITPATSYERYGVSLIKAPYNSLIGVFMRDGPLETMGNSSLTTNDGRKPDKNPQIQQAFFIYHFDRSESNSVSIEVPEGARKLFLGTLDTEGWHNNVGTYHVTVSGIVSNVGTEAVSFSSGQLWVGSYTCVQGRTDLELRIVGVSGSNSVEAIFDFNHQASGCKGSFYLKGIYNSETREMNFSPGKWIKNTCGYGTVGMKGEVLTNPLRYEGRITHSGCGDFRVELVR